MPASAACQKQMCVSSRRASQEACFPFCLPSNEIAAAACQGQEPGGCLYLIMRELSKEFGYIGPFKLARNQPLSPVSRLHSVHTSSNQRLCHIFDRGMQVTSRPEEVRNHDQEPCEENHYFHHQLLTCSHSRFCVQGKICRSNHQHLRICRLRF